jgi:hypothetical protein
MQTIKMVCEALCRYIHDMEVYGFEGKELEKTVLSV